MTRMHTNETKMLRLCCECKQQGVKMKSLKSLLLLSTILLVTSCNYHYTRGGNGVSAQNTDESKPTDPVSATVVTYDDVQTTVFAVSCQQCHLQKNAPLTFNDYVNVSKYLGDIKTKVAAKKMPPSSAPQLSQIQLQALNTWLDAGGPEQ